MPIQTKLFFRILGGSILVLSFLFSSCGLVLGTIPQAKTDEEKDRVVRIKNSDSFRGYPKGQQIAESLLAVKNGRMTEQQFFNRLAELGVGMKEVNEVKSRLHQANVETKLDALGLFLGERFSDGQGTPVEEKLLVWRRKVTLECAGVAVRQFQGKSTGYSVYFAEIGKWSILGPRNLTFAGDIDFSFVSVDEGLVVKLRDAFDQEMHRTTGLWPQQFDSICTAHGRATRDVYLGEHGRMYAESIMKNSYIRKVDLAAGTIGGPVTYDESIRPLSVEAGIEAAAKSKMEIAVPRYGGEPGISLEMIRHFDSDIVQARNLAPVEAIIKGAKYLSRSSSAFSAVPGAQPSDPKLTAFAETIERMARNPVPEDMQRVILERFGGSAASEVKIENNRAIFHVLPDAVSRFHAECAKEIWHNVEKGLEFKLFDLAVRKGSLDQMAVDKTPEGEKAVQETALKLQMDFQELRAILDVEFEALRADKVNVPEAVSRLSDDFHKAADVFFKEYLLKMLTPEERAQKRFVEEQIKCGKPSSLHLAAAYVMDLSSRTIDRTNNFLDTVDNFLLGKLRGQYLEEDFTSFVRRTHFEWVTMKTSPGVKNRIIQAGQRAQSGIQAANIALNQMVQSTRLGRAGMRGLQLFSLVDEMNAYCQAFRQGDWKGLGQEFCRRRIPFVSPAEQAGLGNYYLAAWQVVTLFVPPLAMIDAAIGVTSWISQQATSLYWAEALNLFVDGLYEKATFQLESPASGNVGGVWRLVAVEHGGIKINLESAVAYQRAQIEAMKDDLRKPLEQRRRLRDPGFGTAALTDWLSADETLRQNLAETDPVLYFLETQKKDPAVGPRLLQQYSDQYRVRWEDVKLEFLLNTITRLENRWAAEQALLEGKIPAMFAELRRIADDLKVGPQVQAAIDSEWNSSNFKALMNWLLGLSRFLRMQPWPESEVVRAADIVRRTLDIYRAVLEARKEGEALMSCPAKPPISAGIRLLTGPEFFTGKAGEDQKTAQEVLGLLISVRPAQEARLRSWKRECTQSEAIDSSFDQGILQDLACQEAWKSVFGYLFRKHENRAFADAAVGHNETVKALETHFREHYNCGPAKSGQDTSGNLSGGQSPAGGVPTDPQSICQCSQQMFVIRRQRGQDEAGRAVHGSKYLGTEVRIVKAFTFNPAKNRCEGQWEIWSIISGRKPEKQKAAANYNYSEALSEAKQFCQELKKTPTTANK